MLSQAMMEPALLNGALRELFGAHGVRLREDGEWLSAEGSQARVRGIVQRVEGAAEHASTQVDIVFSPWPGTLIVESFAGFGETLEDRTRRALETFAQNTLHVLLTAFFGVDCGDHVEIERLEIGGVSRIMMHGNAACAGDLDLAATGWYGQFLDLLAAHAIAPGTHWIRLFYAQMNGKQIGIELLLDNDRWTAAEPALRAIEWPRGSGYFSMRLFAAIRGGTDLGLAAGVIALNPQADDDEIRHLLIHAGLSPIEARRASITIPLAFGQELLKGIVDYPETCEVISGERSSRVAIATVPGFKEARAIAERSRVDGSLDRDQYIAVALRDALAKAVNDALTAGHELCGASAAISVLWPESEPFGP